MRTLFITVLALLTFSTPVLAQTAQPDYQSGNTIQNMYENYIDWKNYTDALDAIWLADDYDGDREYSAELMGEALSASLNLITHYEENAYPTGTCAQDFYYHFNDMLGWYTLFYASAYHTLTAGVGETTDISFFLDEAAFAEDWFAENISEKCLNKIDR